MKYRRLPRTDLNLSEVGFGVWTVATNWWGRIEESDRIRLLQESIDRGVNFFDTADTYGEGYGEEILAKALGKERNNIVIATKFGYDFYTNVEREGHTERPQKFEPEFIRYACEQSLKRLKTDYIDLYQLHNPRLAAIEDDEVFDTLDELVKEGKIRYYGSAIGPDIGWFEEGEASMRERNVSSVQIIYSILEQDPANRFFPISDEEEVGLLSRVPHASETLTDKFREPPEWDPSDHRSHRRHLWMVEAIKKADQVRFLAEETGRTMAQAAIKFCLAQPTIVTILPNITNSQELAEYCAAPEVPDLEQDECNYIYDLWDNSFYLEEPATSSPEAS